MHTIKYRILLLLNENKRLSEIAERLDISQPTVTFHLKSLEKTLGVKLFHTKNKYMTLTDTAKSLLPYMLQIVELENTLSEKALQFKDFELGSLIIGATLAPSLSILPEYIARFTALHKHLHISLETASTNHIIENIMKRKYDIGFISSSTDLPPYLITKPFFKDSLVLVYTAALRNVIQASSLEDIFKQYTFIHHSKASSTRMAVMSYFEETKFAPFSTITTNSTEVIKELIKKEIGISILPISLIQEEVAARTLDFIALNSDKLQKEIQLIYHKDTYLSPIIEAFIAPMTSL